MTEPNQVVVAGFEHAEPLAVLDDEARIQVELEQIAHGRTDVLDLAGLAEADERHRLETVERARAGGLVQPGVGA